MKRGDASASLFLVALSGATCLLAWRLGLGEVNNPGSGLIPFGAAALLGLMALGQFGRSLLEPARERRDDLESGPSRRSQVSIVLGALLGWGLALNPLGFTVSVFLLLAVLLGVVARRSWWATLALSALIVTGAYLIFVRWLGVEFPRGPLGI